MNLLGPGRVDFYYRGGLFREVIMNLLGPGRVVLLQRWSL